MPIYEYTCQACGASTEFFQSIKDDPKTKCPSCGKHALKKEISLSSFHLKGSGWYVTDYGGKNNGAACASAANGANGTNGANGKNGTNGDAKKDQDKPAAADSKASATSAASKSTKKAESQSTT